MAFETYTDLQAQIRSFLWDRPDVVSQIPAFIQLAETETRRLIRTRETADSVSFALASGMSEIPCGVGQIKSIKVLDGDSDLNQTRDLDYVAPDNWSSIAVNDHTGRPRFYTVVNDRILVWPVSDDVVNGVMDYVGSFCPLSSVVRCNWLLKRHPDIYLSGALKWAKAWLIDDTQDWATPFYSAIQAANRDNPRVQTNTKLRADEATMMSGRNNFNIRTGGIV